MPTSEINLLIAEKVMGWEYWSTHAYHTLYKLCPAYVQESGLLLEADS